MKILASWFALAIASAPVVVVAQSAPVAVPAPVPEPDLAEIDAALAADAVPTPVAPAIQSLNPDVSLVADFALAAFSEDENLQAGGHDPTEDGFDLQGVELVFAAAVDPYFRFDSTFVFGAEGFELEEAFATTTALPGRLQVRAGQFLTRFGRLNPTHLHAWAFADQPFQLGRVFGGDGNRNLGAEASWLAPLPWYVELVASLTDARGETARSFLGEAEDAEVDSPLDLQTTLAAKQFLDLSTDLSLLFGLSLATGPNASGEATRTDVYGADLYLKWRPISVGGEADATEVALQAEYLVRRREQAGGAIHDQGGYGFLTWRFARRWQTGARYEYGGAARDGDGAIADDGLDPAWTAGRHRVAAQLAFRPSEFSRLRAQGSLDRPRWLPDPILAAFLTLEVSVGAHAAHPF